MSLLRDLQDMSTDPKVRVHQLLLKAQILAARLDHGEFEKWIELELDGYPKEVEVPDYRKEFRQIVKGTFAGPFQSLISNAQLPAHAFPERLRFFFDPLDVRFAISTVEQFAEMPEPAIRFVLPAELPPMIKYYQDMNCVEVWAEQARHSYARVLEAVREKILRYALEIERTNPRAGEAHAGDRPVAPERLAEIQNIILGGTNILAAGNAYQYVLSVTPGDLESLLVEARRFGIPEAAVRELQEAVKADGPAHDKKLGDRVRGWLGRATEMTASGAWTVAAGASGQILAEAILKYYGLK